ncbi:MAG: DUF503 domain-containing protein [Chloroflexi bacterium]|nr:DUF503 domain-containing protein [Chloroflexota bacterium]
MAHAVIGVCTIEFQLPGLTSLKEKRSVLKSMTKRLHSNFNVSAAEIDHQDVWQSAVIAFAAVSNSSAHANQMIDNILNWIEKHYPHLPVVSENIEIL